MLDVNFYNNSMTQRALGFAIEGPILKFLWSILFTSNT